jgi:antitoxin PrlF
MKKEGTGAHGADAKSKSSCCQIMAVVSVDERGQMVLPKAVRDAFGIKAGDRLAAVAMGTGEHKCCLSLMKVDELEEGVRSKLGPVFDDIVKRK